MTAVAALAIAGLDPSGGAGLLADTQVLAAFGVRPLGVATALTVQDTRGVASVHPVDPAVVRAQIERLFGDIEIGAVKLGMLANADVVEAVVRALARGPGPRRGEEAGPGSSSCPPLVLDPVLVSTSGHALLDEVGRVRLVERLLPMATLVTPNRPEAAVLLGGTPAGGDRLDPVEAGDTLLRLGVGACLITGGHAPGEQVVDVLVEESGVTLFRHPRIHTSAGHGTGCALSSAIAAGLALGHPLALAVRDAIAFVSWGLEHAPPMGRGRGPIDLLSPRDLDAVEIICETRA